MRAAGILCIVSCVTLSACGSSAPAPAPASRPPAAAPKPAVPGTAAPPQAKPAPPAGAAAQTAPAAAGATRNETDAYVYQVDGRRDPFVSLIGTGLEPRPTGRRGDGPAGMATADISVSGVLQSRGALVAMIKGPDNKTYIVHQGDKLGDGVIKTITPQGLVIVQEVNDPLSLVKQREIRKMLRALEDAKE